MSIKKRDLLDGSLLVAGTCVGGGILALPVITAKAGFLPSLFTFSLCYLFMCATGLLILEVCLCLKKPASFVSMSRNTLGRTFSFITIFFYFFLFYCLCLSYIQGMGESLSRMSHNFLEPWQSNTLLVVFFSPFLALGTRSVKLINTCLMLLMILSYLVFFKLAYPYVKLENLSTQNWSYASFTLPFAFVSFGYQGILPSMIVQYKDRLNTIRASIFWGNLLALFAYSSWQWLVLGIVPLESGYFQEALKNGKSSLFCLQQYFSHSFAFVECFGFSAISTSFLCVSLGLKDFIFDLLQLKNRTQNHLWVVFFVVFPPLFASILYPTLFIQALNLAGGFGGSYLLGLLPILMVLKSRKKYSQRPEVFGGKSVLYCMLAFVILVIFIECIQEFSLSPIGAEHENF